MQGAAELRCVMSAQDWGLTALGVALLAGCAWAAGALDLTGLEMVVLAVGCAAGLVVLGWVALGRRVRLQADETGLTYRGHVSSNSIRWKNLSSIQFKAPDGLAREMIVVNDMGRRQMRVPVASFDRRGLHDWVENLPARASGLETVTR